MTEQPDGTTGRVTASPGSVWSGVATWPNLITLLRLCCLPIFLWLLFGRDDRQAAAWLLGALGATDWVDGWVARRFDQVSEFGKMFDPTADRLLFVVALVAIMIDGSAPWWFCLAVLVREVIFGGVVAILTLFFDMERFDVTDSAATTCAPSAESRRANWAPNPDPPPVTTTTIPLRSLVSALAPMPRTIEPSPPV